MKRYTPEFHEYLNPVFKQELAKILVREFAEHVKNTGTYEGFDPKAEAEILWPKVKDELEAECYRQAEETRKAVITQLQQDEQKLERQFEVLMGEAKGEGIRNIAKRLGLSLGVAREAKYSGWRKLGTYCRSRYWQHSPEIIKQEEDCSYYFDRAPYVYKAVGVIKRQNKISELDAWNYLLTFWVLDTNCKFVKCNIPHLLEIAQAITELKSS